MKNYTYDYKKNTYDNIGYATVGLHSVFQSCLPKPIFIKAMPTEEEAKKYFKRDTKINGRRNAKNKRITRIKRGSK
ncbi:hypothetical protein OS21_29340 [Dickeya oryzae]